ncbi:MAG TPA: nucleotidyltransferase [Lentisphaeria bacterium]|nr:MAG: nucleotidyltransferase [Lentisphaerae bacterium GWF2_50_93]HCE44755.1 nucleotidyltransferase [Lentisphaeria bacterium]
MNADVKLPIEKISEFCHKHRIKRMSVFGSALGKDFSPKSDIDVIVEFEEGVSVGLKFFSMENELTELIGRKVDLNTPGFLSKYFRDKVIMESEVVYAA